jgi:hypothetical protein
MSHFSSAARNAAADERLCDLGHRDGRRDACRDVAALERVLQCDRVDDRGEHAHVIAGYAVDAVRGRGHAAKDVAAADDDRDLHAHLLHFRDLVRDVGEDVGVDAGAPSTHEGFTGQLEKDALVFGLRHSRRFIAERRLRRAAFSCLQGVIRDYFMYEATSAAKSSDFFSMPSPSL